MTDHDAFPGFLSRAHAYAKVPENASRRVMRHGTRNLWFGWRTPMTITFTVSSVPKGRSLPATEAEASDTLFALEEIAP